MCLQCMWCVPRKNCGEVIKNACCSKLVRRKKQGKQMVWNEIHQNGGRPGPRSGRIVRSELRSDCDRCTKPCDSSIRSALRSGSRSDRTIIAHDLPQDWVKLRARPNLSRIENSCHLLPQTNLKSREQKR